MHMKHTAIQESFGFVKELKHALQPDVEAGSMPQPPTPVAEMPADLPADLLAPKVGPGAASPSQAESPAKPTAKPGTTPPSTKEQPQGVGGPTDICYEIDVFPGEGTSVRAFEQQLSEVPELEERLKIESSWLMNLYGQMEGGLRMLSTRKGFILYELKATTPAGKFEVRATAHFPNLSERTRRYCMAQAREFLLKAGVKFVASSPPEYFSRLREEWTLSRIISTTHASEKMALPDGEAATGDEHVKAPHRNPTRRSTFVGVDTFRQQLRRLAAVFNKAMTSSKRVKPCDAAKAAEYIRQQLPEDLRPSFLAPIQERSELARDEAQKAEGK